MKEKILTHELGGRRGIYDYLHPAHSEMQIGRWEETAWVGKRETLAGGWGEGARQVGGEVMPDT